MSRGDAQWFLLFQATGLHAQIRVWYQRFTHFFSDFGVGFPLIILTRSQGSGIDFMEYLTLVIFFLWVPLTIPTRPEDLIGIKAETQAVSIFLWGPTLTLISENNLG